MTTPPLLKIGESKKSKTFFFFQKKKGQGGLDPWTPLNTPLPQIIKTDGISENKCSNRLRSFFDIHLQNVYQFSIENLLN